MSFYGVSLQISGQQEVQIDQDRMQEVEKVKMDLLRAVMDTKRGAQVTTEQRAAVEDAMVHYFLNLYYDVKSYSCCLSTVRGPRS